MDSCSVIIGCGITSAMTTEAVSSRGKRVLVIDQRSPASGSTSAATALIRRKSISPCGNWHAKLAQKEHLMLPCRA